ncbi:MAG TPA: 50S ribosomal protein L25 [Deltaproteobacteria bacterium]|nr:50S ribosomal protein L25 [Deltaproteobacteria bacterium]HOI05781.1 50S ribosomal protein L25 [Deltaproteobacteria bacterium]
MGTQEKITLELASRTAQKKKVRALRRDGIIPAVLYGKGLESTLVQVKQKDLEIVYRKMHGTSIIDASLDGKNIPVLIHEVHRDTLKGEILHVDFLKVDLNREVTVEVPLVFVGVSPAEKEGRGKVGHEATSISIKCVPARIPSEIEVDVTGIVDKHDVIHASDLKLPEGATLGHGVSPDKVICHLSQAKLVEAAAPEAAEEVAAPEAPEQG